MNSPIQDQKAKIIAVLLASFGQGSDYARIAAYRKMLDEIPEKMLKAACEKLMLESKFLPTISDVVSAAQHLTQESCNTKVKTWDEAWHELQEQRRIAFIYAKPVFSTKEIELTAKRYGWKEFCEAKEKDYNIVHAQMRDIYNGVCKWTKEKVIDDHILKKTGLIEKVETKKLGRGNE